MHLSPTGDQPGDDEYVQECTISAIGTNINTVNMIDRTIGNGLTIAVEDGSVEVSGTSYAAPIVSAAAALVLSHIRRLHPQENNSRKLTVRALLESATPMVLVSTTVEERNRMQRMMEYSTPILLEGMMSKDLHPLKNYTTMLAGKEKVFDITDDMIREMKRRYGRGRLNVEAAIQWVGEHYRENSDNKIAPQP